MAVTLAQRLLLATGFLTVAATLTVGYGAREAWRRAEEQSFHAEFQAALGLLRRELGEKAEDLPLLLAPICAHDTLVDGALVGLEAGDLESRRLSLSLRVPELAKAQRVDELWLITHQGDVLGAHADGLAGQKRPELARLLGALGARAELRREPPAAIVAGCVRRDAGRRGLWVGLFALRYVQPMLERIGPAYGIELSLEEPARSDHAMSARLVMRELGDGAVWATRSRLPLAAALRDLDTIILLIGGGTVALALLFAFLMSRGLARPMVELARQAREVMQGEPRPIVASGPREIAESAAAFNRAIEDLTALRQRLAATERIAAWREIARRVAHEIKNPLAPIRAAIETLRRLRARDDPAFDEYFDEATRTALGEVNRINHIVTEFTEFARLPPPNPSQVDLVELARSTVQLHANLGARVVFVEAPCPEVRADKDQIVQVLTNLIQNALDAVSQASAPRVEVDVAPAGADRVRIRVRDNGPGIAPDLRDRLFVPYTTTKAHGTGLGLAIAQRLILEHGGTIGGDAAEGGGAEFWFELPVAGPSGPVGGEPSVRALGAP